MEKSKELSDPNSCLNRAEPDEPVFVLKSTDPLAASIVRTWAIMYFKQKSAQATGITPIQRAKYEEAMDLALRMDQWHAAYIRRTGAEPTKAHAMMAYYHASPAGEKKRPLESKDVIERLCRLQATLFERLNNVESADCFCGDGGFWRVGEYDGTFEHGYRNDGVALKFIEEAVREKLDRMGLGNMPGEQS